ncbi:MAG: PD40 domain-containing protein [Xanthomonadaceae bacterium]|nr:PD40 domain-containing protein [Xanthomonadaceae bacterium]
MSRLRSAHRSRMPQALKRACLVLSCVWVSACMSDHPSPVSPAAASVHDAGKAATPPGHPLPVPAAGEVRLAGEGWLSGLRNDYNLSTDAAQAHMVFARSDADFENSRIWLARRRGEGWSEPSEVPFSDPRYRDSDPWLTPDGRTLYFASNRPVSGDAPNATLDLWRVAFDGQRFGTPEHLPMLASDGQELGPELHDGWLYFNSSRKSGPAKLAIYRARVNGTGFDAPVPMGAPFNDGTIQGDFTLSPDGRLAVFWSLRDDASELDLFAACRTLAGWSAAVRLPPPISARGMDFTPAFSADGRSLIFASMRSAESSGEARTLLNGQSNLYVASAGMVQRAIDRAAVMPACRA